MKRITTISTGLPPVAVGKAWEEVSASFERFCLAAGIETLGTMMESDTEAACGPRHARGQQRSFLHATVANSVMEQFDRYVKIHRVKLVHEISPTTTGKEELIRADPTDETLDKLEAFSKSNKSETLDRYLEYTLAALQSLDGAIKREDITKIGPSDWMAGLNDELAALCVPR